MCCYDVSIGVHAFRFAAAMAAAGEIVRSSLSLVTAESTEKCFHQLVQAEI